MTTTELIKLLTQNEKGGISHKSREISLTINGEYMPNPQITLSSTGDGVCGPEIDLDVDGDFLKEEKQAPKTEWIPVSKRLPEEAVLACDMYGCMIAGIIYEDEDSEGTGYTAEDDGGCLMSDVVAWQPLPKPYSEVKE